MLGDPAFAKALRQRGREQVQEYFWDKIARELESIYQQTLSKRLLQKNHPQ